LTLLKDIENSQLLVLYITSVCYWVNVLLLLKKYFVDSESN